MDQSWPWFFAEADILFARWYLPKGVTVARTSLIFPHAILIPQVHCAPFSGHAWSLTHGAGFCLIPSSGTSRSNNLWLTDLPSQDVIFCYSFLVNFTLMNLSRYFWTQINFPQPQKPAAKSSWAELQNEWKSIFSFFFLSWHLVSSMFPSSWIERYHGKTFPVHLFKNIRNSIYFCHTFPYLPFFSGDLISFIQMGKWLLFCFFFHRNSFCDEHVPSRNGLIDQPYCMSSNGRFSHYQCVLVLNYLLRSLNG